MTLGELLIDSKKYRLVDLEALIMFVVFEKKVHDLTDDESVLDVYFLDKHKEKMNRLLNEFKRNKGIKHWPSVFEVDTDSQIVYVQAESEEQARRLVQVKGGRVTGIRHMLFDELKQEIEVGEMYRIVDYKVPKEYPKILGGHLK